MVKAMNIKSSNVLTFKITSSAGLSPQDICDALKMDTEEISAYWKVCQSVRDDLVLLLPECECC